MKIKLQLLYVLIIVSSVSCKNVAKNNERVEKTKNDKNQEYVRIKHFPDTVFINKIYTGKIEYASKLDTIKLSKEDTRAIFFYVTTQEGIFNNVEAIEKVKHDIFDKDKTGFIHYRFAFEKLGVNNFKGIIQDMVILHNYYEDGKARIITRQTEIDKEIFVINNNDSN